MSDFPKSNGTFNRNAYRSMAAYNAHKNALRADVDVPKKEQSEMPKPTGSFDPYAYRSQAAYAAHKNGLRVSSDNELLKKKATDMPKANNTFNRHAYRSQTAFNSNKNDSRGGTNRPQQHFPKQNFPKQHHQKQHYQRAQKERPSKSAQGSSAQTKDDEPHFMTDAEVKEWFRQAEEDYQKKKEAGHYKDYVPAGGHTPDFSAFRAKFSASNTPVAGLKNSMHAPPKASEHAKQQGGK